MKAATIFSLAATASAAAVNTGGKVDYDGYKVFRVPAANQDAVGKINHAIESLGLQTWKAPFKAGAFSDIAVPPSQIAAFEHLMKNYSPEVMHENLGDSIARESNFHTYATGSANSTWFQSYHPYKDHLAWMKDLASKHSSNAEVVTSGTSGDGNAITGVHLWGKAKGKPAIVFHGTVHAREWIASMVNEYMLYSLATNYGSDNEITSYLDKYDFYIFPIVNPDGFLKTQNGDRMWRKNTQPNSGSNCAGTDVNRNWPYKWDGPGSSTNPCTDTYRGSSAGSSPENKAITAFLKQVSQSNGVKLYIDWHSYSQLFMSPYGYSCNALPDKNDEFVALAKGAVDAIRSVHGTSFDYGPICSTIYQTPGSSVDWTNDVIKADYSYAVELRDTGRYGFVLPPDQIIPSGEESFAGIKYLLKNMK